VLTNRLTYIPAGSSDTGATHEVKPRMDSLALADGLKAIPPFAGKSANVAEVKIWSAWLKQVKKVQAVKQIYNSSENDLQMLVSQFWQVLPRLRNPFLNLHY